MKKALLTIAVVCLAVLVAVPASAQSKMSLSIGGDVLLPIGDFGNVYSIGFGGTVRGQYDFTPMFSAGLSAGYFTWTAKDVAAGLVKPSFKGVPIRVFGKYYFMPEGKLRVYGMAELGLFFWSSEVTLPSFTIPGVGTIGGGTVSATGSDFSYAPVLGVEVPIGKTTMLDGSVRYDGIATSGSSTGNIGLRLGVKFPL